MFKKALLFTLLSSLIAFSAPKVKVIDLSWSNPTIAFLEQHLAEMEKDSPLDGITIRFAGKTEEVNGVKYGPTSGNAWNKRPWKYELLRDEIQRYKALHFTQFTDNFYYLTTSAMDFDWCSDDDWKNVANNFGVAAKAAREMGLKGLLVDIEEYGKHFWNYGDDVHPKDISFDDLRKLAEGGVKPTVVIVPMTEGHLVQPLFPHLKNTKRFFMRPGVRVRVFW